MNRNKLTKRIFFFYLVLSILFFVIYVPGAFIASWILDHFGLRIGVVIGAGLMLIGSVVRGLF